jgi:hypothetical protein
MVKRKIPEIILFLFAQVVKPGRLMCAIHANHADAPWRQAINQSQDAGKTLSPNAGVVSQGVKRLPSSDAKHFNAIEFACH